MKTAYSYTILRYVHDMVTGEFVNVGVVLFSKEAGFLKCHCRKTYARLTKVFPGLNGGALTARIRQIQKDLNKKGEFFDGGGLLLGEEQSVLSFAHAVLPPDDSALQWSPARGGITSNPEETLEKLFDRMVARYDERSLHSGRTDADVWTSYKKNLQAFGLLDRLQSKTIKGQDDEIEFEHAWKNGIWHCLEPISLDLSSWDNMREKAYKHVGQLLTVQDARQEFKVYMLLGEPTQPSLRKGFEKAVGILKKAPVNLEVIFEQDILLFSERLSQQVQKHDASIG